MPQPLFDEEVNEDIPANDAAYRAAVREGIGVAVRSAAGCSLPAAVVLMFGYVLSKPSFVASDHILQDAGENWAEALWPAALYAVYGLGLGGLIGWRINTVSGLVGRPAWLIGAAAVVSVCAIGVIGAMVIFGGAVPTLVWISSGVIVLCSLGLVTFFANWNA